MRYIHFYGDAGCCGTDYHNFETFPDETSNDFLDGLSCDMAYDNAQSYSYLHTGWGEDFKSEEDEEEYYYDATSNCGWDELSKEEWEELKEDYT